MEDVRSAETRVEASDWHEVATCVTNTGLFADLRDWDKFAELYEPNFVFEYPSQNGGEPTILEVSSAMSMWEKHLSWWDATQHLIANLQIVGNGPEITVRSQVRAIHVKNDRSWIFGGLYTHKLRKTDNRWRIFFHKVERGYEENYEGEDSPKIAWLEAMN